MHPLDDLAANPARLAELEAAAEQASHSICSSSSGWHVVDEAAVRHLGDLLPSDAGSMPSTRDGQRLWRLVRVHRTLTDGILETGRGPVAPTFDSHDRDVEARRGGWYRVRTEAYEAFSSVVRGGLLYPPPPRPVARRFWEAMDREDLGALRTLLADGLYVRDLPASRHGPPVFDAVLSHYRWGLWDDVAVVVRLLVAHGARPNAPPPAGEIEPGTPLELALRYDDADTADLIRRLAEAEVRDGPPPRPDWIVDLAAPNARDAVAITGTIRESGGPLRVRASTLEELREGLAALGVTRVEATTWVSIASVASGGSSSTKTYGLEELPGEFLEYARRLEEAPNAGARYVFDLGD